MRDKIGDHEDRMDAIFSRLLILEEQNKIIMQRINWLENPDTAPKPKHVKTVKKVEEKL